VAADSRINIVLDVDTKNTEQIEATAARLTALGRAQRTLANDTQRLNARMGDLNGQMGRMSAAMQRLNGLNLTFIKHARKLMYLVVGLGIEFLAVTAALVSVNAAFAIGNAAVKLYNWGMQGLAGAVAAAGAAAITAAAAFQEFNAAAFSFRYKESAGLGTALSQSADALRMLQVNSTLASYGITALTQAYAAFSKNAKLDPAAVKQLQAMADFGTGPNRDKSMAAAAEYISLIKKNKGFSSQTTQLASQIGPEFEKVAKKYSDSKKLLADLESGILARAAGVEGFGNTINQTLVAQLRSYLTKAFVELSDAGRYLLEPVKKTFNEIFNGLTRAFRMVRGDIINFGRGGLLGSLEKLAEKTEEFSIKLFREFLPAAAGWWKRTGDFFRAFVNDFKDARDMLQSMREGGSIVIRMFGEPLVQVFRRIGQNAQAFADLAKNNKEDFLAFGNALKNIVDGFFDIGNAVRKAFTVALPIINQVLEAVAILFKQIANVINLMAMLGPIGGTMAIAGLTRYALKGRRSERYERRNAAAMAAGMSTAISNSPNFSAASPYKLAGAMGNSGMGGAAGMAGVNAAQATVNAGTVVVNGKFPGGGGGGGRGSRGGRSTGDRSYGSSSFVSTAGVAAGNQFGVSTAGGTVQMLPVGPNGQLVPTFVANSMPAQRRLSPVSPGAKGYVTPYGGLEASGPLQRDANGNLVVTNGRVGAGTRGTDVGQNRGPAAKLRRTGLYSSTNYLSYEAGGFGLEYRGKNAKVVTAARAESVERGRALAARIGDFNAHLQRYGTPHPEDPRRPDQIKRAMSGMHGPFLGQAGVSPGQPMGNTSLGQTMKSNYSLRFKARALFDAAKNTSGKVVGRVGPFLPGINPGAAYGYGVQHGPPTPPGISGAVGPGGASGGPMTRMRAMGTNAMNFMFGPSPVGQKMIGKSPKTRLGGFLTGAAMRTNAYQVQNANAQLRQIASNLGPGATPGEIMKKAIDDGMDPEMAQRAFNKGKPMGKGKAFMSAAKMKTSMMGGGMLASIGTGMFLESSMGQKMFADPDAQKWMSTGAMLMPFAPMLGLGVGLAGAAFNAKTTGGGMLAGAGAGAAFGSMIGGPVGAAVGAAVGTIVGGISSVRNKNKMARAGATAIADSKLVEVTANTLAGALISGTTSGGRETIRDFKKFVNDFEKMNKSDRASSLKKFVDAGIIDSRTAELMSGQGGYGQQAVGRLKKEANDMETAITPMFDQFDESMRGLQLATGMSSQEIMNLASKMNVNLFDPTVKLTDVIAKLGVGMVETAEQIQQSLRDIAVKSTSVFDTFLESKQMEDAVNAARTRLLGGDTSTEAFIDYYQKVVDLQNLQSPEAGVSNFLNRYSGMVSGEIYNTELKGVTRNEKFDQLLNDQLTQEQTGISQQFAKNIGQALVEKNLGFADAAKGQEVLTSGVSALITKAKGGDTAAQDQLFKLESAINSGTLLSGVTTAKGASEAIATFLGLTASTAPKRGTTVGGAQLTALKTGTMSAETLAAMSEGAKEIYNQMTQAFTDGLASFTDNPQWWTDSPPWWNSRPAALTGSGTGGTGARPPGAVRFDPFAGGWLDAEGNRIGDTKTPKALRATMGAHSRFNSMLPGKRTITSSWREWGLGSPSSDHATGRAYDLTGDNLGQYSKFINDAGGFAEFHGVGGERHLHVVPPIGPIGDRTSPVSTGASGGTSSTYGGDSFTITVVESNNARETADEVVQKILAMQAQSRRRR
jgi:hypothetical protein